MKPAGLPLLIAAGLVTIRLEAAEPSAGLVSREISAHIRAGLPPYQPPALRPEDSTSDTAPQTTDPNVLILPKLRVNEKRLPRDAADHLMSKRDFERKMENLYLDALAEDGPLNVLLNNVAIPILSPSKAERGRAIYVRRELDRLGHVTQSASPELEKKYRQEMDNSHTTRPAGGLREK